MRKESNLLSLKNQVDSKDVPFVGNKSAKLIDGKTEIILDAPHMSFQMNMNYINKDLWKAYETLSNDEAHQKQKRARSKL